ncbi:MAG: outer membrane lipoprotein-sorting protein [Candidatus Omnitrophica bacterium]|jgi:outer membrane lipoprotein-sorting protein|nr:outer membrane lipoprotein-sorting protein [Candidatus Omnitrophota bacterium]
MKKIILCAAFLLAAGMNVSYAQMSADEIAERASKASYYQGKDGRSFARMVITDAQGRKRERQMTILRFNAGDNGEQKYYVYFHKPNDVKGMSYIVWKHLGRDDDRWLYLPALDLVRRVASSDKRSSFAGTNFLYEDISGRSVKLDKHELLSSDDGSYLLKNTPKDSDQVEFSYYKVWVDKNNFVPMKAEYYDKEGKLYRIIEANQVKDIQGYPTTVEMTARDINSGGSTVADFTDVSYGIGISDGIFTERYLRNPPLQWIKG